MAGPSTDLEFIGHDIIKEVMKEYGVDPMGVPDDEKPFAANRLRSRLNKLKSSKRYFCAHSPATFCAHERSLGDVTVLCDRTWISGHTWCIIDLKEQAIIYRFTQKCFKRQCKKVKNYVKPTFDDIGIRKMAEWAVKTHLIRCGLREKDAPRWEVPRKSKGPHCQAVCQMCRLKWRRCWLS